MAVPIGGYWRSMVIRDFDVRGVVVVGPDKAQAELIIDTDGMLPVAVTRQCFQAVARRVAQIVQAGGAGKHRQFAHGGLGNGREFLGRTGFEQGLRVFAFVGFDHVIIVTLNGNDVNRY